MTTMKEIATLAEVSTATVSKIINGNDRYISAATRDKVNRLISEMNYVPNAVAKSLKIKQTRTLGFILPDIRNPFFPEIARGIEDSAGSHGFAVTFCNTDNDFKRESASFAFLQSKMVDGIIITRSLLESNFENYISCKLPIVVVDRRIKAKDQGVGEILLDTKSAFFDITELLISRGCEKLAFISADSDFDKERFDGYLDALNTYHIPYNKALTYRRGFDVETGFLGVESIFAQNTADGVVCGNDLIAVGAMDALRKRGLKIPKDVKVSGFDDIYFSQYLNPTLTTVRQPAYQMGSAAAEMLIKNILYSEPLYTEQLDYELIQREST